VSSEQKEFLELKKKIEKINTDRDEIVTKAYVEFREIQKKAKQSARVKLLELDEKLKKFTK